MVDTNTPNIFVSSLACQAAWKCGKECVHHAVERQGCRTRCIARALGGGLRRGQGSRVRGVAIVVHNKTHKLKYTYSCIILVLSTRNEMIRNTLRHVRMYARNLRMPGLRPYYIVYPVSSSFFLNRCFNWSFAINGFSRNSNNNANDRAQRFNFFN